MKPRFSTSLPSLTEYHLWPKLSIRHWPLHLINLMRRYIWSALQNVTLMKDNGSHRPRLCRSKNKHLFRLLDIFCFFNYHETNQGYTCYVSQVSLFISGNKDKCGWVDYINGNFCLMGEQEVHHCNNSVTSNHSSNLLYVTPYENKSLACIIVQCKQDFQSGLQFINTLTGRLYDLAVTTLNSNITQMFYFINTLSFT